MSSSDRSQQPPNNVRNLQDAIRAAKIAAADRGDVVVDMKEADRVRLELLAEDLKPVFDQVPAEDEQFDFALSSGLQPRLWIDATAHVQMGRDRRTYRFVRDTRLGRVVLAESPDKDEVADKVTAYIGERIVERSRMMEGETDALVLPDSAAKKGKRRFVPEDNSWDGFVTGLLWFLVGIIAGGGMALAWLWNRIV